jgi:hypothetical protein
MNSELKKQAIVWGIIAVLLLIGWAVEEFRHQGVAFCRRLSGQYWLALIVVGLLALLGLLGLHLGHAWP